jgi:hypothetical protein
VPCPRSVLSEPAFREVARSIAQEMATLPSVDDAVDALLARALTHFFFNKSASVPKPLRASLCWR